MNLDCGIFRGGGKGAEHGVKQHHCNRATVLLQLMSVTKLVWRTGTIRLRVTLPAGAGSTWPGLWTLRQAWAS